MAKKGWQKVNGDRLRERREELMLSQRELASMVGSTQATVSALETGARHALPRTVRALAVALGVEPREIRGS